MNTFWVTFYSYKGGVGRTMALANVAALLAKEGRRVLLMDFDLEAPGLDAFEEFAGCRRHAGVVEYASEYLASGKAPPVAGFVHECVPTKFQFRGKLWLMPSGRKDVQYNLNRAKLNWADLYDRFDGDRFVENWKADIENTYQPDYVLIDSRTGLTDVAGVCTLHLPQLVVLLYSLNDQNINGIASVARAIGQADNARHPQLLTVVSPVPPLPKERTGLLQERLAYAECELGVKPSCLLHYDPRIALKEQIIVWDEQAFRLAGEYRMLRNKIAEYDVRGLDFLTREIARAIGELDESRAVEALNALNRDYQDRPDTFYQHAQVARAFGRIPEFEANLMKAVQTDPLYTDAANALVGFLRAKRRFAEAVQICFARLRAVDEAVASDEADALRHQIGELSMVTGDFATAAETYGVMWKRVSATTDARGAEDLVLAFNYAEARRRAGQAVPRSELAAIVSLYEQGVASQSSMPAVLRLNGLQAMHVPYALLGDMDKARELLRKAEELAPAVSRIERIFSVASYDNVPVDQFVKTNTEMLEALEHHRLWDGTPLVTDKEESSNQGQC